MDPIISIAGIIAMLVASGGLIAMGRPGSVDWRWLAVAAGLVFLNDLFLTNAYGLIPDALPGQWNWQGKVLALVATLAIAAAPRFGWRQAGITLQQAPGSQRASLPIAVGYCAFFLAIALVFPDDRPTAETIAFQLTMPGLEEELFYRGLLLLALDNAFTAQAPPRRRLELGRYPVLRIVRPCARLPLCRRQLQPRSNLHGTHGRTIAPRRMAATAHRQRSDPCVVAQFRQCHRANGLS